MSGFTRKMMSDGRENPKYVDLLDEDKPLSGQKFACVSFVSPENILKEKNLFFFEKFLKYYDFTKAMEKFTQFLNFLSYKHGFDFDDSMEDFKEFVKSEKTELEKTNIDNDYKTFIDKNEEKLENEFNIGNEFQTSTRGLKIRGVYPTQQEAELRCRMLREVDPHHNVYVGPVGMWMPWEPDAYKTGRVEYLEEELNQLMKNKNDNQELAKQQFEKRILETKRTAIKKNVKIAQETGNTLTQTINDDGNLVSLDANNTIETNLPSEASFADIRKELFEGDEGYGQRKKEHDKELMKKYQEENKKV